MAIVERVHKPHETIEVKYAEKYLWVIEHKAWTLKVWLIYCAETIPNLNLLDGSGVCKCEKSKEKYWRFASNLWNHVK